VVAAALKREGIESISFRRLSYEMVNRDPAMPADDVLYDIRATLKRVTTRRHCTRNLGHRCRARALRFTAWARVRRCCRPPIRRRSLWHGVRSTSRTRSAANSPAPMPV
jgi:hypothetical protein